MSQSPGQSTDTHAVLQSMLQRLRLQSGLESRGHVSLSDPTAPCQGQRGRSGPPLFQTAVGLSSISGQEGSLVVGHSCADDIHSQPGEQGKNDVTSCQSSTLPEVSGQVSTKVPGSAKGHKGISFFPSQSVISSSTHNNNVERDKVKEMGQATLAALTPTGYGRGPLANTQKDADVTSVKTTDGVQGVRQENGSHCMEYPLNTSENGSAINPHDYPRNSRPKASFLNSQPPNPASTIPTAETLDPITLAPSQNHSSSDTPTPGFMPRVYMWSLKTSEKGHGTVTEAKSMPHQGNGSPDVLSQSKNMGISSPDQNAANSTADNRVKKRLADNKARRWTQKIKEKWRQRPGSFRKKLQEDRQGQQVKTESNEQLFTSNQPYLAPKDIDSFKTDGDVMLPSQVQSDLAPTHPVVSEDCTTDGAIRLSNDCEFGLGPLSLLEEIAAGQEWARFLNLTQTDTSNNQRPIEQLPSQPKASAAFEDPNNIRSSLNQSGCLNAWNFTGLRSHPVSDISMTAKTTSVPAPSNMDVLETNQIAHQNVQKEAPQSEPMDQENVQSEVRSEEHKQDQICTETVSLKPADLLHNSTIKNRMLLNRKRVHHSRGNGPMIENVEEGERDRKEAKTDEFSPSPGAVISQTMEEGGEEGKDRTPQLSLYPLSPSSSGAPAPVLRGVLRHSLSQDSTASVSMETVTKKRRLDDTRHVHFSEEIILIPPAELDLDYSDLEEDSVTEDEDEDTEEEGGMELSAVPVAAAPRASLPAWILALKRKSLGKKPGP